MRGAAAVAAGAALAWAGTAVAATPQQVGLPSPAGQLTASPPLQATAVAVEFAVPGRLESAQRVLVGIRPDGSPASVQAIQRLVLTGSGDYAFIIAAPVTDVLPGPGTESEPGFRLNSIVWQGFSPGRRVLSARAALRLADAAPSLPVRVDLRSTVAGRRLEPRRRRSGALDLRLGLTNTTSANVVSFAAEGVPSELAQVLDSLRGTIERGRPFIGYVASVRTRPQEHPISVEAPLQVEGTIRFPQGRVSGLTASGGTVRGGTVVFSARLGDGEPLRFDVRVRGQARNLGAPVVTMRVTPLLRVRALRPSSGRNWQDAVARGLVRLDARELLALTVRTIYRISRVRQYETFLINPDSLARAGADRTAYEYRSVVATARPALPPAPGGGTGTLVAVLAAVGGVLGLGGIAVFWAHS